MTTEIENVITTSLTGDNVHIFRDGKEFAAYQEKNNTGFLMTDKDADIILGYMEGHGYHIGIKDNQLLKGDYVDTDDKIIWEKFTIDDAIDQVCEWNYEMILDNEYYFNQSCLDKRSEESQKKYDRLKADEKVLDNLFDKTCYGKKVEELANQFAGEIIASVSNNVNQNKAVKSLMTNIEESFGSYNIASGKSR